MNTILIEGKPYWSLGDAALQARMTRRHLWSLVRQGRISAQKHDGRWAIDEASLAAFLRNRKGRPKGGRPRKIRFEPNSA
jgi:hypothetical protein